MICIIYYVSRDYLVSNFFSLEMNLKWPLSGGSQFKLHFYLGWWGNRGSDQSFHITLFFKRLSINISKHEAFDRNKMHGNTDMTWNNTIKLWLRNTYAPRFFRKSSFFTKIKLKWSLSRGSHFNIYFCLECRGNRGSRQNFHEFFFSKTAYW